MSTDFRRVAIVNRGEPAMRFIHAVREYNLEHRSGIRVIALFTEPDRHARFVREADEAVDLGSSTYVDDADGLRRPAYLDYRVLERGLAEAQADAVWTGWGFVAERPEFAEMCERLGVLIIGPDSGSMRRLGDKIGAKRLAEQAGIPVIPWGDAPADTLDAALAQAEALGYPVALKASGGAGGRAIRRVTSPADLEAAYGPLRLEAARVVERPHGVPRAVDGRDAAHRGADPGGPPRDNLGHRNQRLLAAAPVPETRVGGAGDRPHREPRDSAHRRRRAARGRRAVPGPGERRVPRGSLGAVLFPGGEHAPPGRARRHGAHQRHRSGEARDRRGAGRPPRGRAAAQLRACHRGPPECGRPLQRIRGVSGHRDAVPDAHRTGASCGHRDRGGQLDAPGIRIDVRQARGPRA